jgi:copper oxidase (laccase) domain-containing protein
VDRAGGAEEGWETMASRQTNLRDKDRALDGEIERYREAADNALDQLEWTVGYLDQIHKRQIARVLDRNRRQIIDRMQSPTAR